MTQRQFFFIFIMRSKGRERKGGRMIASFARRNRTGQMITSLKLFAWLVLVAFSVAVFSAAIPNH